MTWKPHVTVASVIEKNGQFLLVEETINGQNVLNQPAGHLEPGESLIDAVIRETLEETAWDFRPDYLTGIYRFPSASENKIFLRFNFAGQALQHHPELSLDTGIEQALWMTVEEIQQQKHRHRSPLVQQAIEDFQAGKNFPLSILQDFSWD